ncbi:molluscan insulin-related peptide 3, partial [Biomphalaria glabrata]
YGSNLYPGNEMSSDLTNANLFLTTALLVLVLGVTQTNGVQTHVCTIVAYAAPYWLMRFRPCAATILRDTKETLCQ